MQDSASDCQPGELCSLYSIANGEDPIGTASPFERCLIVEVPTPWDRDVWSTSEYTEAIKRASVPPKGMGSAVRLLAIQRDPDDSADADRDADEARVFWFTRPAGSHFREYDYRLFYVPAAGLPDAVEELVRNGAPNGASREAAEAEKRRELFLCTHSSRDVCCGRFGQELFDELREVQLKKETDWRVWPVSHLGGHRLAPTLMDMRSGRNYGHMTSSALQGMLEPQSENLDELLRCYRGWSGVKMFEQIAEREIWRREGPEWAERPLSGHIVEVREDKSVLVEISSPAAVEGTRDVYTAEVRVKDKVHTLNNSFTEKFQYVNRYDVTSLECRLESHGKELAAAAN